MAIIQCKICGGEVDITPDLTMGECPYCHTVTTFPRFKTQGIEALYRRAEEARLSGNFDKAISTYEEIINSDTEDPEAYWGLVLSTWGIEYVEDPLTKDRKPTCHRVQFESILDDVNFKKALEISSGGEAEIYRQEALKIAEIQKNILKISAQEKPFDIFICYKESDESGQRTPDSVFAQELYETLSAKGYKVFFARVTLEDKVGLYEPYIFSALNSAKAMLVIGSKIEYFEAVWRSSLKPLSSNAMMSNESAISGYFSRFAHQASKDTIAARPHWLSSRTRHKAAGWFSSLDLADCPFWRLAYMQPENPCIVF